MRSIWKKLISALLCVSLLCSIVMPAVALDVDDQEYSFRDSKVVLHSSKDILLNEYKVQINGSVYAETDFTYTGEEPQITGDLMEGDCEIPDFVDLVNASADYQFTVDSGDYSGAIGLADSSVYSQGDLTLDEATLNGAGNLTSAGDILMYITADEAEEQKAIVMSENGDITINGSKFTFNGVLYAPTQALLYGLNFKSTLAWIAAGLPFDAIHGVSNFFCGALILPLISILRFAEKNMGKL